MHRRRRCSRHGHSWRGPRLNEEAAEAAAEVEAEVKNAEARKEEEDAGKSVDKPRASEEGDRA